jgi:hypothetical protein
MMKTVSHFPAFILGGDRRVFFECFKGGATMQNLRCKERGLGNLKRVRSAPRLMEHLGNIQPQCGDSSLLFFILVEKTSKSQLHYSCNGHQKVCGRECGHRSSKDPTREIGAGTGFSNC